MDQIVAVLAAVVALALAILEPSSLSKLTAGLQEQILDHID